MLTLGSRRELGRRDMLIIIRLIREIEERLGVITSGGCLGLERSKASSRHKEKKLTYRLRQLSVPCVCLSGETRPFVAWGLHLLQATIL